MPFRHHLIFTSTPTFKGLYIFHFTFLLAQRRHRHVFQLNETFFPSTPPAYLMKGRIFVTMSKFPTECVTGGLEQIAFRRTRSAILKRKKNTSHCAFVHERMFFFLVISTPRLKL